MPWSGSGAFARYYGSAGWTDDKNSAIYILSSRHDLHDQDLADGINLCITKDGQSKAAATQSPNSSNVYDLGTIALIWRYLYSSAVRLVSGGFYTAIVPAAITGNRTVTLPDADVLIGGSAINTQNGNYTLLMTDMGKSIVHTDASAYAYTIPPNSSVALPIGTEVTFINQGSTAGTITAMPGVGVTLWAFDSGIAGAFGIGANMSVTVRKLATDTWIALQSAGVHIASGTFTGTLGGVTGVVTGTFYYRIQIGIVTIWLDAIVQGPSSGTGTLTVSGVPAAIYPLTQRTCACSVTNNSNPYSAAIALIDISGVMSFRLLNANIYSLGAYSSSNNKGLGADWCISYPVT